MPVIRPIQPSFASGEYSPALYSRVDISKYASALRKCKNFIVHPHGGVSNRPGFRYVANQKDNDKMARVVKFVFSTTQAYVLEFGDYYIRFFTDGGQIEVDTAASWNAGTAYVVNDYVTYNGSTLYLSIQNGTNQNPSTQTAYWTQQSIYQIYSPYPEADLALLRFESSADTIYITHPDYPPITLSRFGDTDWRIEDYEPEDGPFQPENIDVSISLNVTALTGTASLNATSAIFDADQVGALFKLRHYVEGQSISQAFSSATTSSSIRCFTTWRLITHGTWTGKFKIEKSSDGGVSWTVLRLFSSTADFNANTSGTEDIEANPEPFLIRINMHSYTSGTMNVDLTTDPFYQEGIIKITAFNTTTAMTGIVLQDFGATSNTTTWAEGSWSNHRGWPQVARFNQDRLCFAGTYTEPMTIWMSAIGQYSSFVRHSSLLASDGITTNLTSRQLNAINGLVSLRKLLAFTSASEWTIGSTDGAITPTTVIQEVQGYNGSYGIDPEVIANEAIYVQANNKVIRNIGFELQSDGFTGSELNILAKHLFEGYNIVQIAYQQEPDRIVWCLRDDGKLLSLTYMPEQEVVGWAQHETEGEIESICVIPADGFDELWISVNRDGSRFIERMVQRMADEDPQQQFFVDSGITYDNPLEATNATQANAIVVSSASHGLSNGDLVDLSEFVGMTEINGNRYKVASVTTHTFKLTEEDSGASINGTAFTAYVSGGYIRKTYTAFSGISHLSGKTVAILGNGEVYPQQEVSGDITLSNACSIVHIGLPYESDLETLNVELGLKDGTMQGRKVKIANVTFRLINSRGGWIGPNEDNLHEAFTPERLSLGSAPELFSGDVRESLGAGYENGGRVFYRQYDPLPITISAIIPEVVPPGN